MVSEAVSKVVITLRDAEALVGLPHVPGRFDCMHLVQLAQARLFGRQVGQGLPALHPQGRRGQAVLLARERGALVQQVEQPATGDVALFTEGCADGRGTHYHVGLVLLHATEPWLLHTRDGGHSMLQRLRDALRTGLHLEGYYRWL